MTALSLTANARSQISSRSSRPIRIRVRSSGPTGNVDQRDGRCAVDSAGAAASVLLTFRPIPAMSRPEVALGTSTRIPLTFLPPRNTSLGHFSPTSDSGRVLFDHLTNGQAGGQRNLRKSLRRQPDTPRLEDERKGQRPGTRPPSVAPPSATRALSRSQNQAGASQCGFFRSLGGPIVGRADLRMNFDLADDTGSADPLDVR